MKEKQEYEVGQEVTISFTGIVSRVEKWTSTIRYTITQYKDSNSADNILNINQEDINEER